MGQEKLGLDNPDMIRAVGAYGGGIASSGRTCGILLGAIAAVSARYSKSRADEMDDANMWRLSFKLSKAFEKLCESYGGTDCAAIAKVDWRDKDEVKSFYGNPDSRRNICTELTGKMAEYLGRLLEEAGAVEPGE
ncbi:hypothetical protein FAK_32000 [Desulfoferula mesophila]|uniref:C_GCAxxG_C_C family protein n=1 Tax=Desulfoferula mesophila TaxID=3058419 RepID=A0AAU9ESK2_9BACT|nr:hypothetical protein FAK_32000 [Desulfoferula mesophilus]